jgi:hypothetical protein
MSYRKILYHNVFYNRGVMDSGRFLSDSEQNLQETRTAGSRDILEK